MAHAATKRMGDLYAALDPASQESVDAFLASVQAARAAVGGAVETELPTIELTHARGLAFLGRRIEAETVLRAAIESTRGDGRERALLHLDLAEACNTRRESSVVLDLAARVEAMCGRGEMLARDAEVRSALLRVLCQAWIDLGRQERAADFAQQLALLAPLLPPDLRRSVDLQRSNALLALSAWEPLEDLAREELADAELYAEDRAKWQLRLGHALSEIARLDPERVAEARREIETALESGLLVDHEHDAALLVLTELEIREAAPQAVESRLAQLVQRHPELSAEDPAGPRGELDVEQRAFFEALAIERALGTHASREDLAFRRDRAHDALHALRENWALRPLVPGGQGFLLYGEARFLLGQIARLEIALEGERVGVERALAALALLQSSGTAARALDLGVVDADRLRRDLLAQDTTLLVILPNSSRTHVLVLEPDGASASEGASLERLEILRSEHARWLISAPDPRSADRAEGLRTTAAKLRDAVFDARTIAALRSRPVVVVTGTELVGGLPIEALDLGGGRAFGTERGIAHAPSLPLAIALAERSRAPRTTGPWDAVVFGAPEHAPAVREKWPRLAPVPLTEADLRELGDGFAADRTRVFTGPEATLDSLAFDELESARVLQILTHGVLDLARDDPAGLVVARDPESRAVAWRADLRLLRAPRVVALWACGTQRGPTRFGDDTASHLGGAFLEANACSVLVSRADIALEPTLRMARRFARELASGEPAAEALRAARAEVADDPRTADPFFHAPIVLYGSPGRRSTPLPTTSESARPRAPDELGGLAAWHFVAVTIAVVAAVWILARRVRARRERARGAQRLED